MKKQAWKDLVFFLGPQPSGSMGWGSGTCLWYCLCSSPQECLPSLPSPLFPLRKTSQWERKRLSWKCCIGVWKECSLTFLFCVTQTVWPFRVLLGGLTEGSCCQACSPMEPEPLSSCGLRVSHAVSSHTTHKSCLWKWKTGSEWQNPKYWKIMHFIQLLNT